MKKITLAIAAFLLIAAGSFASNKSTMEIEKETLRTVSLSGQVMDFVTGEALAGVKVVVEETEEVSYTDFDGNFSIDGLLPGSYNVSTSYISYKSSDVEVELEDTKKVELKIEQISK